ncbi:MAG: DUF3575 domain-containing protein [Rikenellaceae bacterium]
MRKLLLIFGCCLLFLTTAQAQKVGVKTNLAGWAAYGTINAGVEPALTPYLTFAVDGYYNPYTPGDAGKSTKMWGVQPEIRYWLKTKFSGAYLGINSLYSSYDWGVNKYRYDGWMTGVGVGVGYSLPFAERWRAGVGIGAGWLHRDYSKSGLPQYTDTNITYYDGAVRNTFSITKAEISIQFIIR